MGLEDLKAKYEEEKDERKRRKISEMMLDESRVMCRFYVLHFSHFFVFLTSSVLHLLHFLYFSLFSVLHFTHLPTLIF